MRKKKVNSQDVAKAAGVSQSTVSMILNGKNLSSFTDNTVQRVIEAAEALGYRRARSKEASHSKKNTIMIFCPVLSNPYYSYLIQTIEQAAYEQDVQTLICTTYRSADIEMYHLRTLNIQNISGIIFTGIPLNKNFIEELNRRLPVVIIGDRDNVIDVDTVEVSSYRAGMCVAKHLTSLGHHSIAFISTTLNEQNIIRVKRMEGIRAVLEAPNRNCRLTVKSREISAAEDIGAPDIEHKVGYSLTKECLEDEDITAIIGANDMVAYGIMDALMDQGFGVPDDYSVCGFDNIFPSGMKSISLTTVENHMAEKGRNAFDILYKRIKQSGQRLRSPAECITRIEYPPRLIIRSSTGVPRKKKDGES